MLTSYRKWLGPLSALQIAAATIGPAPVWALSPSELDRVVPKGDIVDALAKNKIGSDFIETLKAGPANFRDYQCFCRLYSKKSGAWKDCGAADVSYKYRNLFRIVVKSSDYRNGSQVVKDASGRIRGCGGGAMRFVKMTLQPDSRTLRLPTGYSLAQSDFCSLYDALKESLSSGKAACVSASPANVKLFSEPVLVLVMREGPGKDSPITEVVYVNPKTKAPMMWNTFKNGEPNAIVLFENVQPNVGLTEDLFSL